MRTCLVTTGQKCHDHLFASLGDKPSKKLELITFFTYFAFLLIAKSLLSSLVKLCFRAKIICGILVRPRGYKKNIVLNFAENEILDAHKYENIKKFSIFLAQISLECYFFCSGVLKCQQLLAF